MNQNSVEFKLHEEPVVKGELYADYPGPKFFRKDLEQLASGNISELFGKEFVSQDAYHRQVRMPMPPLLLADRVLGIQGEPCSMKTGTIWTETDVDANAWYTVANRMPAGVVIESGQADLLLISWLGVDVLHNKDERVYRLLGCELSYHQDLPKAGSTLHYKINIDGHANHGDVRLFFFNYQCWCDGELLLTVKNGQAGFFTNEELDHSQGVIWDSKDEKVVDAQPLASEVREVASQFPKEAIAHYYRGDLYGCFGEGYEFLATHTRTPTLSKSEMGFWDQVEVLDLNGGPWGRGFARATQPIAAADWFFIGHFKNDPCMPGTLMVEAGLQLMAFYLTAMGLTFKRDGWRFQPLQDQFYKVICRGQVTPKTKMAAYEIMVEDIGMNDGKPYMIAHLMGYSDGLKSFYTRIGIELVPDWPMEELCWSVEKTHDDRACDLDGLPLNYEAMLSCANGQPTKGFNHYYARFDGVDRVARLPGHPYHCVSRIEKITGQFGQMKTGEAVHGVFDIDASDWYFEEYRTPVMPFSILLEANLQPCGWLASYSGCALTSDKILLFRNLDGEATIHRHVTPEDDALRTETTITQLSSLKGMIITGFELKSYVEQECVSTIKTVFGFFLEEAFLNQPGLNVPDVDADLMGRASNQSVNWADWIASNTPQSTLLKKDKLDLIEVIDGQWDKEGVYQKGAIRAYSSISPNAWYFKAHFFQDPVMPGSLGLEALVQLAHYYLLEHCEESTLAGKYLEPIVLEQPFKWKYRGQVIPTNKNVQLLLHVKELDLENQRLIFDGSFWVEKKRIYEVWDMGVALHERD